MRNYFNFGYGIQSFNVLAETFGVFDCENYQNHQNKQKKKLTPIERRNAKFALGQFMYDDLNNEDDLNDRLIKNGIIQ